MIKKIVIKESDLALIIRNILIESVCKQSDYITKLINDFNRYNGLEFNTKTGKHIVCKAVDFRDDDDDEIGVALMFRMSKSGKNEQMVTRTTLTVFSDDLFNESNNIYRWKYKIGNSRIFYGYESILKAIVDNCSKEQSDRMKLTVREWLKIQERFKDKGTKKMGIAI